VEYYVAVIKPGRMMIEVGGMSEEEALKALKMAQYKFPIRTKIVTRYEAGAGE
jgi:large subunit ribosomal protein L16